MKKIENKNFHKGLKKAGASVFLLFLILSLSGCSLKEILTRWDEKIGETFNDFQEEEKNSLIELIEKKSKGEKSTSTAATADDLTLKQKKQIDDWLEKKGLNRYGDAKNAIYAGGTPLFDEATGKAIDRYDYLLNKFPNLLELIENN